MDDGQFSVDDGRRLGWRRPRTAARPIGSVSLETFRPHRLVENSKRPTLDICHIPNI